ncbi:MAG: response regulator [Myxococcota bacterium]
MSEPVVLIVDDVPDLLQIMEEAVRMTFPGYDVRTAATGTDARIQIEGINAAKETLALVISDQALGDATGLSVLESARACGAACVLVTGRATSEVEEGAKELGAHLLWKPFRLASLLNILHEAVPTIQ